MYNVSTSFTSRSVENIRSFLSSSSIRGATPGVVSLGILDHPAERKLHSRPVPLLGGIAIYLATSLSCALGWSLQWNSRARASATEETPAGLWLAILGSATILVGVGILDDRGRLGAQVKLVLGMPGAALIVALAGGAFAGWPLVAVPEQNSMVLRLAGVLVTIVVVTGVTAALSIFDHMDGLCGGIATVSAGGFAFLSVRQGDLASATAAAALSGATLGFLAWNYHPARIFMGDAGALFIGFLLALLLLRSQVSPLATPTSTLGPFLFLGVPLFDAALVTVSRLRRRLNPFSSPGKDHTAHRLANR